MKVEPYLFFNGRADEAIEYYREALGAELTFLMRYQDNPEPNNDPSCPSPPGDKVMHANLSIGGAQVMVSDGHGSGELNFEGFSLTLEVSDVADAERLFAALAEGGQVQLPITQTFFSPRFGMVTDRFGVAWMVMATPQEANTTG